MNVAFFIDQIDEGKKNSQIFNSLNDDLEKGKIKNGSIFFKEVGFSPVLPRFAMFNSTDIWNFTGTLIATSISTFRYAMKAVNNYDLIYYFNKEKADVFSLNHIMKTGKVIVDNEEDEREIYRLTNKKPILVSDFKPHKILETLNE